MKLYTFSRIKKILFLSLAKLPMPGRNRVRLLKHAGIQFVITPPAHITHSSSTHTNVPMSSKLKYKANIYIGRNVCFDGIYPDKISIGNNTIITSGTHILTHFFDTCTHDFVFGEVKIGANVFIGMNTIICKPVTIGDGAVIGAGSIVTKNIPANEVWAGNPARFIKKLK